MIMQIIVDSLILHLVYIPEYTDNLVREMAELARVRL